MNPYCILLVSIFLLSACSPTYKYKNIEYSSREELNAAFQADINQAIGKVSVVDPRVGGSLLIVMPNRDYIAAVLTQNPANARNEQLQILIDNLDIRNMAHVDIVKAGKVFDKVATVKSPNTQNQPSDGYDYKLWLYGNKSGNWQWYLSKTGSQARETVNLDTGLTGSSQFDSFNVSLVKAAFTLDQNPLPGNGKNKSFGTGFFVNDDSLAVSNAHVIKNCKTLEAVLNNGETVTATVINANQENDLALIKVAYKNSAHAQLRISYPVRQGEQIITYGYPLAGALASQGNLATGIVSALAGIKDDIRRLQISAPVQQGNSGGPVLDQTGNVIGIVDSKLNALKTARVTGDIPQNVNFAIKASVVVTFLEANAISYDAKHSTKVLTIEDLGDKAKEFTFMLQCQ